MFDYWEHSFISQSIHNISFYNLSLIICLSCLRLGLYAWNHDNFIKNSITTCLGIEIALKNWNNLITIYDIFACRTPTYYQELIIHKSSTWSEQNLISISSFEVIKKLWWYDCDTASRIGGLESTFILSSSLSYPSLLCSSSFEFSPTFNEFLRSSKLALYFFESHLWTFAGLDFLNKNATRSLSIYIF